MTDCLHICVQLNVKIGGLPVVNANIPTKGLLKSLIYEGH